MEQPTITLHVEFLDGGGYLATSHDVPGLIVEGRTIAQLFANARDVQRQLAQSCQSHGDALPPALLHPDPRYVRIDDPGDNSSTGKLAGLHVRDVTARLRQMGFVVDRQAVAAEIWRHTQSGRKVTIPSQTKEMPDATVRAILREVGMAVDEFLAD